MKPAVRRTAPAALVLVGLALAGCGPTYAGAAAVVGSGRVTTTALNDEVRTASGFPAAAQTIAADPAGATRRVLAVLVQRRLIEQAAAERRVSVSDGDVTAYLATLYDARGGQAQFEQAAAQQTGLAPGQIRELVRDDLLVVAIGRQVTGPLTAADAQTQYGQAGSKALTDLAAREGVSVAPRYGAWDLAQGQIVDATPPFLVAPGGTAAASPAPAAG